MGGVSVGGNNYSVIPQGFPAVQTTLGTPIVVGRVPTLGVWVMTDVSAGWAGLPAVVAVRFSGEALDFIQDPGVTDTDAGAGTMHWVGEQVVPPGAQIIVRNAATAAIEALNVRVSGYYLIPLE